MRPPSRPSRASVGSSFLRPLLQSARAGRRSWARFRFRWQAAPGRFRVMARATDERRTRQPLHAAWNGKGYGQNGVHLFEVTVADRLGEEQ